MQTTKILIDRAICDTKLNKSNCRGVINSAINTLVAALVRGESVTVSGLGVFKVVGRARRYCRDFKTGKVITIPAHNIVKFTPCRALRNL